MGERFLLPRTTMSAAEQLNHSFRAPLIDTFVTYRDYHICRVDEYPNVVKSWYT